MPRTDRERLSAILRLVFTDKGFVVGDSAAFIGVSQARKRWNIATASHVDSRAGFRTLPEPPFQNVPEVNPQDSLVMVKLNR